MSATVYCWPCGSKCVVAEIGGVVGPADTTGIFSGWLSIETRALVRVGRHRHRLLLGVLGVAGLLTNVARSGYCQIYVTTRAIGVASSTREYLEALSQKDGHSLPKAPVARARLAPRLGLLIRCLRQAVLRDGGFRKRETTPSAPQSALGGVLARQR